MNVTLIICWNMLHSRSVPALQFWYITRI